MGPWAGCADSSGERMNFLLYPGELGVSLFWLLLTLGAVLLSRSLLRPERTADRVLVLGTALALTGSYLHWRVTETLPPPDDTPDFTAALLFLGLEATAALASVTSFVLLSRQRNRSPEVDSALPWWPSEGEPSVAVLVPTYDEEAEVVERTVTGALQLEHPALEVIVLDDGDRDWLEKFCQSRGVTYLRRDEHHHAKAGNLNAALHHLLSRDHPPDFLAILDADFVPHRDFLERTLPLMANPSVGIVQTPQHFFNPDPVQQNLGIGTSYPDEQRYFFDTVQPARDGWGISFCCGSCSLLRVKALQAAGGFPTESITEDFLLSLALQEHGYTTVYLNEALTEGLAPEGIKEFVTQRTRWSLGLFQIARSRLGPLGANGLRLRDRFSVLDAALYWTGTFSFRLAAVLVPLLYWWFDLVLVDTDLPAVVLHFGVYYLWMLGVFSFLSRGKLLPLLNDASQLIVAPAVLRSIASGLFSRRPHPFEVTAKGGDHSQVLLQWRFLVPVLAVLALYLGGFAYGLLLPGPGYRAGTDGKWIVLFWSLYNVLVLGLTALLCIEIPRPPGDTRRFLRPCALRPAGEGPRPGRVLELGLDNARIRGEDLPDSGEGTLELPAGPSVPCSVEEDSERADARRLRLQPRPRDYDQLVALLHSAPRTPDTLTYRIGRLLRDLFRRLATPAREMR